MRLTLPKLRFRDKNKKKTPQRKPGELRASLGEIYALTALILFEGLAKRLVKTFEIDKAIDRAGMNVHPVLYLSKALLNTLVVFLAVLVPTTISLLLASTTLVAKIIVVLIVITAPIVTFAIHLALPSFRAGDRKSGVETELPFFMAYASAMMRGGLSIEKIIERIANLRVFKAMREEAQRILTNIRIFGQDPMTAIENVVRHHPCTVFRDLMLGYTITLRTGGDVVHYMEIRTQEIFEARMNEIKRITERLSSFLELYIVIGVIMSITIFVFFAVSGTLSAATAGRPVGQVQASLFMPSLYNFVILPILGLVVLFMIHASQPKTPIPLTIPYYVLLGMAPLAALSFLATLSLTGGTNALYGSIGVREVQSLMISATVAALVLSVPPWLSYRALMRGHRGLVSATADFLREMSEIRKTGLSPEKCFVQLSTKDFRNLTPIVSKIGVAISLGLSIEDAMRRVLRRIREWFVIAIFRFLTDTIVVGGGSPEVIDMLARFTQTLSEMESELRRRMRSYVLLPYFGAVMLAASPIIIIGLLATAGGISTESLGPLMAVLGLGSLVNSYIMGLIAGKTGELSVAAGFKHAALMVVITTTATLLAIKQYT
jgi:flagellar protein FlaJ